MPVHILECYDCGDRIERNISLDEKDFECPVCGGVSRIVFDWGKMQIEIFQPFVDNGFMGNDSVRIESKTDWANKCKQNGVVSHALEGGYKSYERRRWF